MPDDKDVGFIPRQADSSSYQDTERVVKADLAGNVAYDDNPTKQELDSEILKHRTIGRRMSVLAVVVMAVVVMAGFSIVFFGHAIYYGNHFIKVYTSHIHRWASEQADGASSSILPLVIPVVPATFFSLLGLATMVTCVRFISAYVNSTPESRDADSLIERLIREIGNVIRLTKGGGD